MDAFDDLVCGVGESTNLKLLEGRSDYSKTLLMDHPAYDPVRRRLDSRLSWCELFRNNLSELRRPPPFRTRRIIELDGCLKEHVGNLFDSWKSRVKPKAKDVWSSGKTVSWILDASLGLYDRSLEELVSIELLNQLVLRLAGSNFADPPPTDTACEEYSKALERK